MASAIELYQRAYDSDYRKGDWQYAEELYRTIVEKYPYSDEKEYALVHLERLEKLKANPHDQALQPVSGQTGVNAFNVLTFVFVLFALAGCATGGYFVWHLHQAATTQTLLMEAVISHLQKDTVAAVEYAQEAARLDPQNPAAYRYLAERYLSEGKPDLAEIEYRRWKLARPNDPSLSGFAERLHSSGSPE